MSITDELRVWGTSAYAAWKIDRTDLDCLHAIADRIDAEHAAKVVRLEAYRAAVDGMLKEYVKLPVDADGVPIHLGDVMEWSNGSFTVHELKLTEDGWQTWDSAHGYTVHADECIRHVQPDSWERIMDDAEKLARGDNAAVMELVERCRRLAGEGA